MREIKFRAWDKKDENMFDVRDIQLTNKKIWVGSDGVDDHYTMGFVGEDFELMQFTGAKDFFGNDIYDGDIVFLDSKMMNGKVFNDGISWRIEFENDLSWLCDYYENLHVVGNIYETPELLK